MADLNKATAEVCQKIGEAAKERALALVQNELLALRTEYAMQPEAQPPQAGLIEEWLEEAISVNINQTDEGLSLDVEIEDEFDEDDMQWIPEELEAIKESVVENIDKRITERVLEQAMDEMSSELEDALRSAVEEEVASAFSGG